MDKNYLAAAEAYYTILGEKNVPGLEKYLHPDIRFITPLGVKTGKEAYLEAVKEFVTFFKTLTIRGKFASGDQAMIVYDLEFPPPIGQIPTVALMTFKEDLVTKIELFYDARPLDRKKVEVFS